MSVLTDPRRLPDNHITESHGMSYLPGVFYILGSLCFIAGTIAGWLR